MRPELHTIPEEGRSTAASDAELKSGSGSCDQARKYRTNGGLQSLSFDRRLVARPLAYSYLTVFLADASWGIAFSSLPLYAKHLEATVFIVGVIASALGIIRIFTGYPLGVMADRRGKKMVITLGVTALVSSELLMIPVSNSLQLIPLAIIQGFSISSIFPVAFAYLAEVSHPDIRRVSFGIQGASMGAGFTLGPLVAGFTIQHLGFTATYLVASVIALSALGICRRGIATTAKGHEVVSRSDLRLLFGLLRIPRLQAVFAAGFCQNAGMIAIFGFFPLYGKSIGLDALAILTALSIRTFASTLTRVPAGYVAKRIGSAPILVGCQALGASAFALLAFSTYYPSLVFIVVMEGVGYGAFITSGFIAATEGVDESRRGASAGLFDLSSSLSTTVVPVILGSVGEILGLAASFHTVAMMMAGGALISALASLRRN